MKNRLLKAGLVATALFAMAGSAYAQDAKSADNTKVTIALSAPTAIFILPFVAQQEGLFAKHGVNNVEIVFGPGPQTASTLAGGAFNMIVTPSPAAELVAMGTGRVKVLAAWQTESGQSFLGGAGIKSVKDLKGRKVAMNGGKGSATAALVAAALRRAGMSVNDVSVIVLQDSGASAKAFASGQVDAAVAFPPNSTRLLKGLAGSSVIDDLKGVILPGAQISANDAWAKAHPDLVTGVLRTMNDALKVYRREPDKVKKIIAEKLKIVDDKDLVDLLYQDAIESMTENLVVIDNKTELSVLENIRLSGFDEATDDNVSKIIAPEYANKALGSK